MKKVDTFKNRINNELKAKNTNAFRVSKLLGIPRTTMREYVTGRYEPKLENLEKLARYFNVEQKWLLGYDVPKKINEEYKNMLISKISSMTENQLKQLNNVIDIFMKLY